MFGRSKKPKYSEEYINKTVLSIEEDIQQFVIQELALFKSNPDNKNFEQSAVANIALFNLPALATQNGYDQIVNLYADHFSQLVGRRINQELHTIYIRYGNVVDEIVERTMTSMEDVYQIDERILHKLNDEIVGFWLQPFIRKAYFDIINTMPKQ